MYLSTSTSTEDFTEMYLSTFQVLYKLYLSTDYLSTKYSCPALVYINDLEEGVTGKILKFADDTKLFTKTREIGDKQKLQDDIDKLVKWSEKWQMLFNFGK